VRVIVIGRGVFGLAAAASLAESGQQVVVVGPRDPSSSSEDISRIVRDDYGDDDFHHRWAGEAVESWRRWNAESVAPLFHQTGLLNVSQDRMERGGFVASSFRRSDLARRMDALAITDALPFLVPGRFVDGYLNPSAGWVDASAVLRHMERVCEERGVGIVPERVAQVGDGWVGLGDDGLLRADRIVVAAGAWTSRLVPESEGLLVPSGQPVVYLRPAVPARFADVPVWALDLPTTGIYGFPATPDGIVKVGHHGPGITRRLEAVRVPDTVVERLRSVLRDAVPELAAARIDRTRVCFYCDAPGGRFVIDRVPGRSSVVVAAGGSGHGFKFAPVLGDLIAAVVLDRDHSRRRACVWREPGAGTDVARAGVLGGPPR
jgi:sarcosine oxidase / L-pipecolate oxidase